MFCYSDLSARAKSYKRGGVVLDAVIQEVAC
jgi:hypothetical protein